MKRQIFDAKKKPLQISRLIALTFASIILIGTLLLMLPAASRSGQSCGFLNAFFTATSATCVTGLAMGDTWSMWSGFGQVILLVLIEIGGLGFMSAISSFLFLLRRKVNMQQQMVMAQSIGAEDLNGIVKIQKRILIGSISIEGIGALLLSVRFMKDYSLWKSIRLGIFHSVSAFCNAGFDIMGFEEPGSSMMVYGKDPVVLLVLSLLIILGGLGFLVWNELYEKRSFRRFSVYTKLVLFTSFGLIGAGMVLYAVTEWNNPGTIGGYHTWEKLLACFFQSVTTRTAGFAGLDQSALTDGAKGITIGLMLIGGSSGSTAGGLKTVTFVVLLLFLYARMRGRATVDVFNRKIPEHQVLNALFLFSIMSVMAFLGGTVIAQCSGITLTDALYETVSALATVGLSTGITPQLSVISKLILILFMYFGRVGIMTISFGFLQQKTVDRLYQYAETNILIG